MKSVAKQPGGLICSEVIRHIFFNFLVRRYEGVTVFYFTNEILPSSLVCMDMEILCVRISFFKPRDPGMLYGHTLFNRA